MRMVRYSYAIIMKTSLGDRRGQLSLDCEQGNCQGVMTLLDTRSSITGTPEPGGQCELRGLLFYSNALMHSSSCAMLEQVTMGMAVTLCRAKYRSDACVTSAALPKCSSWRNCSSLSGLP